MLWIAWRRPCMAVCLALAACGVAAAVKAPEEPVMRVEVAADGALNSDPAPRQIRSLQTVASRSSDSREGKDEEWGVDRADARVAPGVLQMMLSLQEHYMLEGLQLLSLLVPVAVATYLCHKWHDNLAKAGLAPKCGCRSMLCFLCCTPFAVCCPVDASSEGDA
mmetsp:Transcript_56590/g.104749  ORF Transcript_56590/g.104749 Transcript_56590/m.104749 type:complete len:164 (+) Transcript_56590:149-640(+)